MNRSVLLYRLLDQLLVGGCSVTVALKHDPVWVLTPLTDASSGGEGVKVETRNNVVQLSGFVDSAATMSKAVEIARSVEGVTSVKNDMRLK